ncbi:hypothetical protein EV421DRAFT_1830825 [Armillaria borealis]|uniref:F-box domain-containing protein n=1 Tax=Armillaria borealis TaxID=47425 RepID=A0AA39J7R3_9AGAR|nr:hypothetical protein EV421DRAFT_1830825 [Armillaria borealis]
MSGRAYAGNSYSRAPQVTLSSLASLVSSLKQQQETQSTEIGRIKNRIQSLEKENEKLRAENSDLWNEINKIKGPRFPPELFDRFIDFLHHDNEALKACSLVCRAWIPASRFHLFEWLSFDIVRPIYARNKGSYEDKVKLLDSSFCTLFKHIREIYIDGLMPDGYRVPIPSWLQPLAQHLNRFTGVTVLHLCAMSTSSIRYIIDAPSFTSRITNLSLDRVICSTFNDLPYMLSYFPRLERLHYEVHFCDTSAFLCPYCVMKNSADRYAETLAIDDSPSPPPVTLQVISSQDYSLCSSCYSAATSALYHWFCVSDHTHLRTLMLGYLSHKNRDEIIALSSYLHGPGATLKHIRLGFETEEAIDLFSNELESLSRCSCLETLHITSEIWPCDTTRENFHHSLVRLSKFLLSLPTTSMKKITFDTISFPWSLHPNPKQGPNSYDFSAIDRLLHRFSVLEEITFKADGAQGASLRSSLPNCEKKGILRVVPRSLWGVR